MRPVFILLAIAGIGIITWLVLGKPQKKEAPPKQQTIAVSKHTDFFNGQVSGLLADYNKTGEHFVAWDSVGAAQAAGTLMKDLDNTVLDELKTDSSLLLTAQTFIDNAKADVQTIMQEKNIRGQREAYNSLTDNLSQFLNTVKYDKEKLYLQECTMAFDDTRTAYWLSNTDDNEKRRNPYLGLHHPTYHSGMLRCGETKTTINHTGRE